jgi:hypothetical protein
VAEGTRLLSGRRAKLCRGFESRPLRRERARPRKDGLSHLLLSWELPLPSSPSGSSLPWYRLRRIVLAHDGRSAGVAA